MALGRRVGSAANPNQKGTNMFRNLKSLGAILIALIAAGALSAFLAFSSSSTPASAQELDHAFDSEKAPAIITGANEATTQEVFTIGKAPNLLSIKCNVSKFEGTVTERFSENLTLRPTYSDCEYKKAKDSTVVVDDCAYFLPGHTEDNGDALLTIECAPDNFITITIGDTGCTLRVGEQTPRLGVNYATVLSGGKQVITTKFTVKEFTYKKVGAGCAALPGDEADGTITGMEKLLAYEDKGQPQVEPTTPTGTMEGAQLNFSLF